MIAEFFFLVLKEQNIFKRWLLMTFKADKLLSSSPLVYQVGNSRVSQWLNNKTKQLMLFQHPSCGWLFFFFFTYAHALVAASCFVNNRNLVVAPTTYNTLIGWTEKLNYSNLSFSTRICEKSVLAIQLSYKIIICIVCVLSWVFVVQ